MSAPDRSVAFSPQWLRDEANRLAQSASPNQQDLTIKLMTPLMSDSERNNSPSPPSKGLTGPLDPLFDNMAYLNDSDQNDRPKTPQKPQSGKNSAFATPTRRHRTANTISPLPHASGHRSTPSSTRPRLSAQQEAALSSPEASQQGRLTLDHGEPLPPFRVSHTASPRTASKKKSPIPYVPTSKTDRSSFLQRRRSPSPLLSDYSQSPEVRSAGIATHLEEEDVYNENDEEIHGLSEAKAVYLDRKLPDFVVRKPSDSLKRKVLFRPRRKQHGDSLVSGELSFEYWDEEQKQGFWTLIDDEGFKWIVKYFFDCQAYRAWMGVDSGYDKNGLAFTIRRKQGFQKLPSQSTVVGDSEESENETADTGRTFRKRNIDQVRPYSTELMNYKRSKDGKKTKNFKREYTYDAESSAEKPSTKAPPHRSNKNASRTPPASRHTSTHSKAPSSSRLSGDSIERKISHPSTRESVSDEKIQANTTLYIFTNDDDPPATVYLKSCSNVESFFSIMPLVAGVDEHDIRQITVRFDWLPESTPNTIRMIPALSDSYDKMMEEIREAPGWMEGGDGKASVIVNVVLK
ncbi:hypothetical protein EPUS_07462 [Endocarpon pusillum Z07020]|uniref:Uncharacterized protein n=1 Tax=Endocarpon pusillum (strain Z07020 / HMAS-L-300199) TaxID=1263415 RepID=U1G3W0_ENDPU|nr:uncharacterized protein EPUS_07462 [Endocarpon pusillum Z07020]ERF71992.1 hypothetical protein EPUS_07462 [Endocarpon pusillum Z07020]